MTPETTTTRLGLRARQAAETRARLLKSAREVFEEKGFLGSSVADIVRRAGVAHGTFYTYFDSREDVFRVIAQQVEEELHERGAIARARSTDGGEVVEHIREGIRRVLEAYREQAGIMRVIEEVSRYDKRLRASRNARLKSYIDELAPLIAGLQRHGLANTSIDPTLACAILGSITMRFPELWLIDGVVDTTLDDAVENITSVFSNGLGLALPERPRLRRTSKRH
jgi:AcrR family transcriptional regulator